MGGSLCFLMQAKKRKKQVGLGQVTGCGEEWKINKREEKKLQTSDKKRKADVGFSPKHKEKGIKEIVLTE